MTSDLSQAAALSDGMSNVEMDCVVGRSVHNTESLGGLDWQTPCPHPALLTVNVVDDDWLMPLCDAHYAVMRALGLIDLLRVSAGRQNPPGPGQ